MVKLSVIFISILTILFLGKEARTDWLFYHNNSRLKITKPNFVLWWSGNNIPSLLFLFTSLAVLVGCYICDGIENHNYIKVGLGNKYLISIEVLLCLYTAYDFILAKHYFKEVVEVRTLQQINFTKWWFNQNKKTVVISFVLFFSLLPFSFSFS